MLTPEQIKNWRTVLCGLLGPYALIMPDEDVQKMKDTLQDDLNKGIAEEKTESAECECDRSYHGYTKHLDGTVTCNHCKKIRLGE